VEQVLVVARVDLFGVGGLQGVSDDPAVVARFLQTVAGCGRFAPRALAEQDENLKQIVRYGVVWHRGHVFLFRRGKGGNEAGLRGRWSIGLGGHVNPTDGIEVGPAMLRQALLRELAEEVALEILQSELWAVLNDDDDPAGRRHFGFVYRVEVASDEARSREPGKIQGAFVPLEVVWARCGGMETWSRMLIRCLR